MRVRHAGKVTRERAVLASVLTSDLAERGNARALDAVDEHESR
jgi:hypothetical protein